MSLPAELYDHIFSFILTGDIDLADDAEKRDAILSLALTNHQCRQLILPHLFATWKASFKGKNVLWRAWQRGDAHARAVAVYIRKCDLDFSAIISRRGVVDPIAVNGCLEFVMNLPNLSAIQVEQLDLEGEELHLPPLVQLVRDKRSLTSFTMHSWPTYRWIMYEDQSSAAELIRAIHHSNTLQHIDISESSLPYALFQFAPKGVECNWKTLRIEESFRTISPNIGPRIVTMHQLRELDVRFQELDIPAFEPGHLPHLERLACPASWLMPVVPTLCSPSFRHLTIHPPSREDYKEELRACLRAGPGYRGKYLLSLTLHPIFASGFDAKDIPLLQELIIIADDRRREWLKDQLRSGHGVRFEHYIRTAIMTCGGGYPFDWDSQEIYCDQACGKEGLWPHLSTIRLGNHPQIRLSVQDRAFTVDLIKQHSMVTELRQRRFPNVLEVQLVHYIAWKWQDKEWIPQIEGRYKGDVLEQLSELGDWRSKDYKQCLKRLVESGFVAGNFASL